MQTKLLNDIAREIAGEQAVAVLEILINKKDVNEFLVARKMKLTINQVRNIFYKLANFGLVSFTRKKDKRKGWYTYFWTLETYRCLELLGKRIEKDIENLKTQLKNRQTKRFYTCQTCKTEVGEETALIHDFICQECGQVYELTDDTKTISLLKIRIERLEKQRIDVLQEIEKLKVETDKKAAKAIKKIKTKTRKKTRKTKVKKKIKKVKKKKRR